MKKQDIMRNIMEKNTPNHLDKKGQTISFLNDKIAGISCVLDANPIKPYPPEGLAKGISCKGVAWRSLPGC